VSRGTVSIALVASALGCGCVRDAEEAVCPPVGAGDLVIDELRGHQRDDDDEWGEWIEIRNATGAELDLRGLVIDLLGIDGGTHLRMGVRRSLPVAAGDWVVIGRFADEDRPDYVDVGLGTAWAEALPSSGAATLLACGETIDRVVYEALPTAGTYALSGATWCDDTTASVDPDLPGAPGTPGAENPPCP